MASTQARFSDQGYINWVKDTLSLLYLKEGVEGVIDTEADSFHKVLQKALGILGAAPQICSTCTPEDMKKDYRQGTWKMKSQCLLCNAWLQQIVQNHANYANQVLPTLHPANTNPQLWTTKPYEVFKCYMSHGCQGNTSAKDGDAQSILSLLKNCGHFTNCGKIGRCNLIPELLEIRNSLFHSGNFLVADPKLQADMQTMLDFLGGLTALSGVEQNAVDEAIDKILQLQANKIDLSLNRELELRALQQQQIALEKDLGTLQKEVKSAEVKGATTDLAVKTIQTELGTHSASLKAVKSDMKSLQKEVKSAESKGATTDLAVKTIQTELGTHSASLKAVRSDMKSLQKEVKSAESKGATTDLAVKTIQTELGTHSNKLSTVESEMKILQKAVTSATAKSSASELDIKTLREKTKGLELHKQQVEGLQDQFRRFLQANGLEQDLARLSTAMDKQGQTLEEYAKRLSGLESTRGNQETQLQSQQATLADHDTRLQSHDTRFADHDTQLQSQQATLADHDTGLQSHDARFADHDTQLQSHDTSLADHDTRLQSHDTSLADHGTRLQSHDTSLADHDTRLQSHDTSLADHGAQLQSHDTSLADHRAQLQSQNTSLADHDTRLQSHDTSLADHGAQLQSHDTSLADHGAQLQSHDTSLADHGAQVQSQNTSLADHDTRLQSHDTSLADHGAQLQSHNTSLADHETRLQSHDTSLADHGAQLQSTQEKIATIEEAMGSQQTGSDTGQMTEADIADLQVALIKHYRDYHLMVPNPVVDAELGLDEIYVPPDIKVLRETKNPRTGLVNVQESATPANTSVCKQLFYTEDYRSKSVYVTSDAGMGKTMFSKHLVNMWCRAQSDKQAGTSTGGDSAASGQHTEPSDCPVLDERDSDDSGSDFDFSDSDDNQSDFDDRTVDFTEDDKSTMSNFQLLFYVTLRNSSNKYDIVDMIDAQILHNIKFKKTLKAFDLLQNEGCLVIIDGLDEWTCPEGVDVPHFVNPGVPGRMGLNSNTVYLTTTRPWKFDVLKLKGFDVDKHVELKGLNKKSSKQLCSKVMRLMSGCENVTKARNVWAELKKKGLSHLHNVPVILTLLICLFFDKQELGNSQVQLYCSMIEMLLKRPDKGLPKPTLTQNTDRPEKLLPECFSKYRSCQAHQHLLVFMAKIAFEALFNEERENSLVFESSQMTIFGVDQEDIDLCLKAGILSQNKVLGKWSVCEKRMSFLHKTLQEFLAAIFITNSEGGENVLSRVKSYCSTVEKLLEMSQVFMFVSGLNIEVACKLLIYFMTHVVCNDTAVQQYRQNTDDPYGTCIHSIQTCIVDCSIEALNNQHSDNLPLHDFIIDKWTISECFKRLLTTNISAVKSVFINTRGMTPDDVEFAARTLHQLQDKQCLQKLYLVDPGNVNFDDETMSKTITNNSNLSSLVLERISLSTETSAAVCGALKHLTALKLSVVKLPHKEKQRLLSYVLQAATLRQLKLVGLNCTDHGNDCWPGIDISQLNTSCLQHITLYGVTIQERLLRQFVHQLSSVPHKVTVDLGVTVTADSENPVDLSYLTHDRCLVVTHLENIRSNTWHIHFHTQQQTTT